MSGYSYQVNWESTLDGEPPITCIDISTSGGCSVAGTADGRVVFFGPRGRRLWQSEHGSAIIDVRASGRGHHAVALIDGGRLAAFETAGSLLWEKELRFDAACMDLRPGSNLIALGNRFGYFRHFTIHGKRFERGDGEVKHPVDFIRFSPGGRAMVVADAGGHVSLIGPRGAVAWTAFVHRMITGLDVAERASLVLAPSLRQGIVAIDGAGQGIGVYEVKNAVLAAEIDDDGRSVLILDDEGNLLALDREARLLSFQSCGFQARVPSAAELGGPALPRVRSRSDCSCSAPPAALSDRTAVPLKPQARRLAVDSDGTNLLVAATCGMLRCFRRAGAADRSAGFVEVEMNEGSVNERGSEAARFLEV